MFLYASLAPQKKIFEIFYRKLLTGKKLSVIILLDKVQKKWIKSRNITEVHMTKQRAILLSIFRSPESCGKHRTADEILALAREQMPGISRATVYNNLRSMEDEGLIRRITGEDGADVYDSSFVLHGHLVCLGCHKICDVDTPDFLEKLRLLTGLEIDSYELKMRYLCDDCRTKI